MILFRTNSGITGASTEVSGNVANTYPKSRSIKAVMFRVSEGVRSTHGRDGAIVLDVQQGQMFNVNRVGSRILELLEGRSEQADIVNVISQEFRVSSEIAERDVVEFIEVLKKHKLLFDR